MSFGLGIDAGGTYTDAVIVDFAEERVVAKSKALTTSDDFSRGIAAAIGQLPASLITQVQLVSLSTTLATNAIVEGKGGKVGALLLGFDGYDMTKVRHHPRHAVPGRTDIAGKEMESLGEEELRGAVADLLHREQVDAFAVSGMVSVMNPTHEIRAREIIAEISDKPVVCGHELTMQLDTIKRTTTAVLNARLLPIIAELVAHVRQVMGAAGIHAPLMIVRGDGTLMSEEMARRTPVETILSGPAASVCGAQFLSRVRHGLVADIGGTTTDIALLVDGDPIVSPKGVRVGNWATNVRAVDIETVGLGGDSAVSLTRENRVIIGPRRAIPLSFLAHQFVGITEELARLWEMRETRSTLIEPIELFVCVRNIDHVSLTASEARTLAALQNGPLSREQLAERTGTMAPSLVPVDRLETLGYVQRSTLTPTDVMHHLGIFTAWDISAAEMALRFFAHRAGANVNELAAFILDTFSYWTTLHLMRRIIRRHHAIPMLPHTNADRALLDMLADGSNLSGLTITARYEHPLIALGAPAHALARDASRKLGAELIIPEHAEVANAVGAITGAMTLMVEATITPTDDGGLRVHSPAEVRDFTNIDEARAWSGTHVLALLDEKITSSNVEGFDFHREVRYLDHNGETTMGSVFLECRVRASAVARPQFASLAESTA